MSHHLEQLLCSRSTSVEMRRIFSYFSIFAICIFFNLMLVLVYRLPSKGQSAVPTTRETWTMLNLWKDELEVPIEEVIYSQEVPHYFKAVPHWKKFLYQLRPILRPNLNRVVFGNKLNVVAIVNSAVCHQAKRQAIRTTWGRDLKKLGGHLFFIIGKLSQTPDRRSFQSKYHSCWNTSDHLVESAKESDIIQYDFVDNYYNMTYKSVLLLKFFNEEVLGLKSHEVRFSHVTTLEPQIASLTRKSIFLLKTDDDVYFNVGKLFTHLTKYTQEFNSLKPFLIDGQHEFQRLLVGHLLTTARPYRDNKSRFYTPTVVYNNSIYPPYLLGSGFVMSAAASRSLFATIFFTNTCPYNPFDDLFITGFCAPKSFALLDDYTLNPKIPFDVRPSDNFDVISQFSRNPRKCCNCFEGLISKDDRSPNELKQLSRMPEGAREAAKSWKKRW